MKRKDEFDVLRIIGNLWIVAVWHMGSYTGIHLNYISGGEIITGCFMAFFFFTSGMFLNGRKTIKNKEEYLDFWKKRAQSFVIPFAVSVFSLMPFFWFSSISQAVQTLLGVSCFFPPMAGTLWFSSILLFCYYVGAHLLLFKHKAYSAIGGVILYSILCFMYFNGNNIDERAVVFVPFFLIGLIVPTAFWERLFSERHKQIIIVCLSIVILFIGTMLNFDVLKKITIYFIACIIMILVARITCNLMPETKVKRWFITNLSRASSFSYFFHRQYFIVARKIVSLFSTNIPWWIAYLVLLPVFEWLCIWSSRKYNKICQTAFIHR